MLKDIDVLKVFREKYVVEIGRVFLIYLQGILS